MKSGQTLRGILRKKIIHRKIPYLFQWNQSNHRPLVSNPSLCDLASSLWSFLDHVYKDEIPHHYFSSDDFGRASTMRLANVSRRDGVSLIYMLAKEGLVNLESYSNLLNLVRRVASSSTSHSSVLSFLLNYDPCAIASEVPVYSKNLKVTGHVDLLRLKPDNTLEVLDFKPGLRNVNLVLAIPQVAMYGVLLGELIPLTKNHVECTLFNTQESVSFRPDLIERLNYTTSCPSLEQKEKPSQLRQSTLDSLF